MAQYAQFNPSDALPQAIVGWYDTDVFDYLHLPPASELVEMTDAQWEQHFINPNGWTVVNGQLTAPIA